MPVYSKRLPLRLVSWVLVPVLLHGVLEGACAGVPIGATTIGAASGSVSGTVSGTCTAGTAHGGALGGGAGRGALDLSALSLATGGLSEPLSMCECGAGLCQYSSYANSWRECRARRTLIGITLK